MHVRASQLTETIPRETKATHKLISVPTHSKMYHTNDWVIIHSLLHVDNKRNCSFSDKHHIRVIISSSFHWNVRSEIVIFGYISRLSIKFKSWKWTSEFSESFVKTVCKTVMLCVVGAFEFGGIWISRVYTRCFGMQPFLSDAADYRVCTRCVGYSLFLSDGADFRVCTCCGGRSRFSKRCRLWTACILSLHIVIYIK